MNSGKEHDWAGSFSIPVAVPSNRVFFFHWWSREHPKSKVSRRGRLPVPAKSRQTPAPPVARGQKDKPVRGLLARPLHAFNRGVEKLWNPSQPTETDTSAPRSRATPLWLHVLFCLPTCRSVPRGQKSVPRCRTPCQDGRAEHPGGRASTSPRPGVPLPGRPLAFLPSSPRVSGMPREPPSHVHQPLLGAFPHTPRCSQDSKIQGSVSTSGGLGNAGPLA